MLPGLEILSSGLLYLAAGAIQCAVPEAPMVNVAPITRDIEYDFSRSRDDLGRVRTNSTSPYDLGADTATGGLRHDAPKTVLQVKIAYTQYPDGRACFWYDTVDFKIHLQPKIYIAREYEDGACREAILAHELEHVTVDRRLVNQLARDVGRDMRAAVNRIGALGPYNAKDVEKVKAYMTGQMNAVAEIHQKKFEAKMKDYQQRVDSLEEYERISRICHREGY